MPIVPCPHCSKPVSLPTPWTGAAYTCPHCRRVVPTSEASPPAPPPSPARASAPRSSVPPPPPLPLPPPPPLPAPEPEEDFDIDPVPRRRRRRSTSPVIDFITFRLMITPILIQIIFWFWTLACIATGLMLIGMSFSVIMVDMDRPSFREREVRPPGESGKQNVQNAKDVAKGAFSLTTFVLGVGVLIMGPLLVRLYCELLIIIFKIHDELKLSNDRQRYRTG